jgi:sugar/nucleoside kinase (ribokinase family)
VSTIGAGDAFNAGIIFAMLQGQGIPNDIPASAWDSIIGLGIRFSEDVCLSMENYISIDIIL